MKLKYRLILDPLEKPFTTLYLHRKVTISSDKKYVAMCGRYDGEPAYLWELPDPPQNGEEKPIPNTRLPLLGNNFLEFIGEKHLLMGDGARIWDVDNQREIFTEFDFRPEVEKGSYEHCYFDHCMDLSADGTLLLGAPLHDKDYYYYHLGVWSTFDGRLLGRVETPRVKYNNARVSFTGKTHRFYFAAQLNPDYTFLSLTAWEVRLVESQASIEKVPLALERIEVGTADFSFDFSPDGELLMVGDRFYDLTREGPILSALGQKVNTFGEAGGELTAAALTNRTLLNKSQVLVAPRSGVLALQNLESGASERLGTEVTSVQRAAGEAVRNGPLVEYPGTRKPGVSGERRKMLPKVVGMSREDDYLLVGDNEILFVWVPDD